MLKKYKMFFNQNRIITKILKKNFMERFKNQTRNRNEKFGINLSAKKKSY